MTAEQNPRMKSFVGTVRQLSAEEKIKQQCEARRLYNLDINTYKHMVKEAQVERDSAFTKLNKAEAKLNKAEAKLDATKTELDQTKIELEKALAEIARLKSN